MQDCKVGLIGDCTKNRCFVLIRVLQDAQAVRGVGCQHSRVERLLTAIAGDDDLTVCPGQAIHRRIQLDVQRCRQLFHIAASAADNAAPFRAALDLKQPVVQAKTQEGRSRKFENVNRRG